MLKTKFSKRIMAGIMAGVMTATASVTSLASLTASAGEELGAVDFNEGVGLPWHICESATGVMSFELKNQVYNVKISNPGGDGEGGGEGRWDCQFRHRGLTFEDGHKYRITYSVWTSKRGRFYTKLGNITNNDAEYWHMNGQPLNMPKLGNDATQEEVETALKSASSAGGSMIEYYQGWNDWKNQYLEANQWTTYAYEFTVDYSKMENVSDVIYSMDHDGVGEWTFHLGGKSIKYQQDFICFEENTLLKFDNMALIDLTDDKTDYVAAAVYEPTGIELNQVGYYPNLTKKATLVTSEGDNSVHEFTVKNAAGETVYTGNSSGTAVYDENGGWDYTQILDFSDFTEVGEGYYIECDGKKSLSFNIGNDIYDGLLTNAMSYFYQNRAGVAIDENLMIEADEYQDAAPSDSTRLGHTEYGHNPDVAKIADEWVYIYTEDPASKYSKTLDVTGGWYDAGDHGKYVVNGGISLWTLMNIYERSVVNGDASKWDDNSGTVVIPERGNGVPDILDEVKVETDFFLKMQRDDGMVYHKIHDYKWTALAVAPWSEAADLTRVVKPVTFAATLNFAASLAQASRLFGEYQATSDYAATLLTQAEKAYAAAKTNYYPYSAETDPDHSMYAPLDQNKGGGPYGDTDVTDEFYWAACELYITTGDSKYKTDLDSYKDAYVVQTNLVGGENNGTCSAFTWGTLSSLGTLSMFLNSDAMLKNGLLTQAEVNKISDSLVNAADFFIEKENSSQYGVPYVGHEIKYTSWNSETDTTDEHTMLNAYEWGSNSIIINNAIVMALAYDATEDITYLNGVSTAFDYLLGRNPLEQSYVTGYGEHATTYPHHRWWSYQLNSANYPMAPKGVLSGGPNSNMEDPMVLGAGYKRGETAPMKCYLDNLEAWSVNECTINWNSPLVWVVSFLEDEGPTDQTQVTPDKTTTTNDTTTTTDKTTTTTQNGTTTTGVVPPGTVLIGDVNLDNDVSLADLVTFQKYLRQAITFNAQQDANAACDQTDDEINDQDATALMRFLIKLTNDLPITK